jgi:DNA-binding MarR family transcriptional regulator
MPDINDRRNNLIHLTDTGKNLQQSTTLVVKAVANKTLNDISEEELDISRQVLKKIMTNLQ